MQIGAVSIEWLKMDDWIAVSDRLPPDRLPVRVKGTETVMGREIPFEQEAVYLDGIAGTFGHWQDEDGDVFPEHTVRVTHWKPLLAVPRTKRTLGAGAEPRA